RPKVARVRPTWPRSTPRGTDLGTRRPGFMRPCYYTKSPSSMEAYACRKSDGACAESDRRKEGFDFLDEARQSDEAQRGGLSWMAGSRARVSTCASECRLRDITRGSVLPFARAPARLARRTQFGPSTRERARGGRATLEPPAPSEKRNSHGQKQ